MFTTHEATSFLQDQWGVERVQERFQDDGSRKGLLEEVVTLVQARVPFQSVTLMATPLADRKRPSTDVIKEECKAGIGGLCYNLNVFVWGLLRGAGFTAHLCSSTVATPNDHIIVLVFDVERKGEVRLVDCGMGFPTLRSIPLDFEHESPTYVDSFLEYKLVRRDGQYQRMHGDGQKDSTNHPLVEGLDCVVGKWRKIYTFTVSPSDDLSDFDALCKGLYTNPNLTPFHHSVRCLAFPEKRAVILVNRRLILEKEEEAGELATTVLDGDEAIVDSYRRYFPSLPEDTVRRALEEWHSVTQH